MNVRNHPIQIDDEIINVVSITIYWQFMYYLNFIQILMLQTSFTSDKSDNFVAFDRICFFVVNFNSK